MNEHELDRTCVQQCLQGDHEAFAALLDRYEKPVYNAVYRLVGNTEEARDICQEAFVKVFQSLRTYDPSRKFFSWMYRVAINETINHLKERRRWEPLDESLEYGSANPEEALEATEREQEVHKALVLLEPKYRLALIVRHFLQLSYAEAAHVLDLPEKTVKSRLFTARQLLRDILEGQGHAVR